MVRLEIGIEREDKKALHEFTFQYGQIRNIEEINSILTDIEFTFQYGQIRNHFALNDLAMTRKIYIPVWLDQKSYLFPSPFENNKKFTFQYGQIRNNNKTSI